MNKIALGTVQFGLDYGINNSRGKIPREEVFEILNTGSTAGIGTLDTAYDYGESEKVIGQFLLQAPGAFKVVTKLPACDRPQAQAFINESIQRLNGMILDGLLIHHFDSFKKDRQLWEILKRFKSEGRVSKIGFSLYYPAQLLELFELGINLDMVQLPYSLFDRRFEPHFGRLKDQGIEIHVRSVFLQGLIFKNPEELSARFGKMAPKIRSLQVLGQEKNIPLAALAVNFAVLTHYIF